jgi:flagellar hook-length control protein FliK
VVSSTELAAAKNDSLHPVSGIGLTEAGQPAKSALLGSTQTTFTAADSTAATTQSWAQVDKANVISQLIDKARLISGKQNSEIVISLKPEFLGQLSLRASMVGNELVATITTESHDVRSMLESHLPVLQQALQDQGVHVAKVEVVQGTDINLSDMSRGHSNPQHHFKTQSSGLDYERGSYGRDGEEPESGETSLPQLTPYNSRAINLMA